MTDLRTTTKVAILLTARWAVEGAKPLSNGEFGQFARWLPWDEMAADMLMDGMRPYDGCPIDEARVHELLRRGLGVFQSVEKWLQAGLWVISRLDENYPERFQNIENRAPVLLFGYGDTKEIGKKALGIFGSRNASDERMRMASEFGRACAADGITVVSGGAAGVDSAAMNGAAEAGGAVVGLLADSLLKESGRKSFRDAILGGRLCLMSEVHPEARFEVGMAMARNRLAYACADAALVVECEAGKGGTWSGAIEALREGRKVFVLEGAGAEKELAEKGAVVVESGEALHPRGLISRRVEKRPKGGAKTPETGSLFDDATVE